MKYMYLTIVVVLSELSNMFMHCLLQGRYGLVRFLRDGYKTPLEVGIGGM